MESINQLKEKIQRLLKEKIQKLEIELKAERETVDFYADLNNWSGEYRMKNQVINDCERFDREWEYIGGKKARERQAKRLNHRAGVLLLAKSGINLND